jgi:hypothetical protein
MASLAVDVEGTLPGRLASWNVYLDLAGPELAGDAQTYSRQVNLAGNRSLNTSLSEFLLRHGLPARRLQLAGACPGVVNTPCLLHRQEPPGLGRASMHGVCPG